MTVEELSREQLDELKFNYFFSDDYDQKIVMENGLPPLFPSDIPDWVIFALYRNVEFAKVDFSCTAGQ